MKNADEDFRWFVDGEKCRVGEMETSHLHHAVKFLDRKIKKMQESKRILGQELNARRIEKKEAKDAR